MQTWKKHNRPARPALRVAELSEKGPVREENQDRSIHLKVDFGHVSIVSDGMGGHKGGARAAQLVVDELSAALRDAKPDDNVPDTLKKAFARANQRVYQEARSGAPETHKMGATAVLLLIRKKKAYVAHVGDSRAYLHRNVRLQRLTRDHTRAQRMVDAGVLTPEEAVDHPSASVLERAMGAHSEVAVEISNGHSLKPKDAFLLCSDGLSGFVSDTELKALLNTKPPVDEVPVRLYEKTLQKGSDDNITVQYIMTQTAKQKSTHPVHQFKAAVLIALIGVLALIAAYQQFFSSGAKLKADLAKAQQKSARIENELLNLQRLKHDYNDQLKKHKTQYAAVSEKIVDLEALVKKTDIKIEVAVENKDKQVATIKDLERKIKGRIDR